MKRDMNIVRKIILATAELPLDKGLHQLDGVPHEDFVMHVNWLIEAGLVHGFCEIGSGSMVMHGTVSRLTWDGCDFADAIKSDGLWAKAQENIIKPGMSFTFDLLKDWLKAEISQGFPTLLK